MSDRTQDLLHEQALRLFDRHAAPRADGDWPAETWQAVAEAGFTDLLLPETAGGLGGSRADAASFMVAAGARAVTLPLAETIAARALLAAAGQDLPPAEAPLGLALAAGGGARILWPGQCAEALVLTGRPGAMAAFRAEAAGPPGATPAGQPAMPVRPGAPLPLPPGVADAAAADLALLTAAALSGAMAEVLEIATTYARERIQFGRPIGGFQAVQQLAAEMAGLTATAHAAVEAAAAEEAPLWVSWVAKARAGEAAGRVAAIGHQIVGALGYTREFRLHDYTRLLWTWRDCGGDEGFWHEALSDAAFAAGAADSYWPFVTGDRTGDRGINAIGRSAKA